jgi:nicotinamidase-related amidase
MKAIVVVDVLNGFCRAGNLASPRLAVIVEPIRAHLERELAAGAKAIFIVDTHAPDDPEFAMFPEHCVAGSGEDEIVDELKPFAVDAAVIRKSTYSAFYGTDLERVLREMAPDEVEVVGVCADICVMHTVADLRVRGYPVTVRADLIETYDSPGHPAVEISRFALDHMRDILGARVE